MSDTHRGLFIVFEGGEGSGKSTQAAKLADALELHGIRTHLTREPGDTPLGKELRRLLLDRNGEPISQKAEALLFAADRAEHVEKVIHPKLEQGFVVICDRYMASTMAYQAYAGGLDKTTVKAVSLWASSDLQPDLTFFLDVDPVVGLERTNSRGDQTRFEDKSVAYHTQVREGFIDQRNDSWVTIDARRFTDEVHEKVLDHALHIMHVMRRFWPGNWENKEVCTTPGYCDNPKHVPGVTPWHYEKPTPENPKDQPEDLSDMAQYGLRPEPVTSKSTATACGFAGCIDHPAAPKVVGIDGGY